jgi:hypothetical protein
MFRINAGSPLNYDNYIVEMFIVLTRESVLPVASYEMILDESIPCVFHAFTPICAFL